MLKDGKIGLGGRAWRSPEPSLEASLDAEMALEVIGEPPGSWLGKKHVLLDRQACLSRMASTTAKGAVVLWVPSRVQGVLWLGLGGDPHPGSWSRDALHVIHTSPEKEQNWSLK